MRHDGELPRTFENGRLLLRPYEFQDVKSLLDTLSENRARLENDFPSRLAPEPSRSEIERFIEQKYLERERRETFYFGIWTQPSGEYAGEISLKDFVPQIPSAEFGYFAVRECEGKGIISSSVQLLLPFAFETLKVRKLQIRCSSENLRSQKVATRCGFILEGILRNMFICRDGRLFDLFYYGMTREDFRKKAREVI